jgi:hypothetical protein
MPMLDAPQVGGDRPDARGNFDFHAGEVAVRQPVADPGDHTSAQVHSAAQIDGMQSDEAVTPAQRAFADMRQRADDHRVYLIFDARASSAHEGVVNFDLFMVLPRPAARITLAAKLEFSSNDRSEYREAGPLREDPSANRCTSSLRSPLQFYLDTDVSTVFPNQEVLPCSCSRSLMSETSCLI